jgi:hypothetical protein
VDYIDAVEAGFQFDLYGPSLDGEMAVANLNGEVLADLAAVDDRANRHADRRRFAQRRVLTPHLARSRSATPRACAADRRLPEILDLIDKAKRMATENMRRSRG